MKIKDRFDSFKASASGRYASLRASTARGAARCGELAARHPYVCTGAATGVAIGAALVVKGPLLAKAAVYVVLDLSMTGLIAYNVARRTAEREHGRVVDARAA